MIPGLWDILAPWTRSIATCYSHTTLPRICTSRVTTKRSNASELWMKRVKSSIKMGMKNLFQMTNSRRCTARWSPSTRQIKCSMRRRGKAELVFTWLNSAKRHPILARRQRLRIKICSSHSTGNQALSFGVVFPSSRWLINFVETIKT